MEDDWIDTSNLLLRNSRAGRLFKNSHKHIDEWGVALELIEALGLPTDGLQVNECDPPDAIYKYKNMTIGIENTFCGVTHGRVDSKKSVLLGRQLLSRLLHEHR